MANRKNNQNENPSADTQAVTTNDGGQEIDAMVQPVDAQQEATEPPKGEDVPQGNSGTGSDTTNSDENPPSAADKQDGTDDTPSADRKGNANGNASAKSVKMTLRHKATHRATTVAGLRSPKHSPNTMFPKNAWSASKATSGLKSRARNENASDGRAA